MLPDDDDGSETGGGPPPDPSMREWRHPSEVAAAAAAATSTPSRSERPRLVGLATTGGLAIGVASLLGLGVYLVGFGSAVSPNLILTRPPSGTTGLPASAAVALSDSSSTVDRWVQDESDDTPSTSIGPRPNGQADADSESDSSAGSEAPVEDDADAPSPTIAPTTTDIPGESIDELVAGALLEPSLRPAEEEQIDGVFALRGTRLERAGGFVAIDGLVFTSASALGNKQRVALHLDGAWTEAKVVGADRITDVAVMQVDDPTGGKDFLAETTLLAPDQSEVKALRGSDVVVAIPGNDFLRTERGKVLSDENETIAIDGTAIYGTLRTSMVQPEGSPGSAIYDSTQGVVIGMVINSPEYLTTLIPIGRVLAVGNSYLTRGVPATEWLGVTGTNVASGGVAITEVDESGPAAREGVQAGDVIIASNDVPVMNIDHLMYLIRETGVDGTTDLTVIRDGDEWLFEVTVGSLPVGASTGP